jgi:hypothetical protein
VCFHNLAGGSGGPSAPLSPAFAIEDATAPPADGGAAYSTFSTDDLKVWPQGALPASKIAIRKPDFQGAEGFRKLKASLYDKAESMDSGSTVTFDVSVQDGEIGYFLSRGHRLHLLKVFWCFCAMF